MKIETTSLRSKVARRIFMLFIVCALLPITVLACLCFSHVTKQLTEQSQRRLHQTSKAIGMAIFEQLLFLEANMKMLAFNLSASHSATLQVDSEEFSEHLQKCFNDLVLITNAGIPMSLFGHIQDPPELTSEEKQIILSGKTLLFWRYNLDLPPTMFMSLLLDPKHPTRGILLGEIKSAYLWGINDILPPMTELCVLDKSNKALFSSIPTPISLPEAVALKMIRSASGQFKWNRKDKEYLASYWSIFLKSRFSTSKWVVVVSKKKADMLTPIANFKKNFLLVTLLSLWVVLFLSIIQIRRNLIPLERLQVGTQRIAKGDFGSRVSVTSGDEFEKLAASFNTMASQLDKQFKELTAIAEIDQAILSALDTEKIVATVLTHMPKIFPCDGVCVTLVDSSTTNRARAYVRIGNPDNEKLVNTIHLNLEDVQRLSNKPENILITADDDPPHYLAPLASHGIKSFLVLPLFLKQRLLGIITLGYLELPPPDQEDLLQIHQLADQVAVALSNAHLIEELSQLNWGTLTALARAVDAKSSWTAGHSEQVTELALKIGRVIGLTPKELDVLHRAGLLHDIGKIGTPRDILDKPGKLTNEEYQVIQEHPRMGARILEPISAYAEVIPIVLQHHERIDGSGYPHGLSGETICLGARIMAVADSFDAMTSERPYRHGMDRESAVEIIKQDAGHLFDLKVVEAFLKVMSQEKKKEGKS